MIALFKKTALRLLILLPLYSFLRLIFYIYYLKDFKSFDSALVAESFFLGLRFDLSAILLLNAFIVFIPGRKIQSLLFSIVNFLGVFFSLVDNELFFINGKRLSRDFFLISSDIVRQLPQLTLNYWYVPLISIILLTFFYFIDQKIKIQLTKKDFILAPLYLGLCFVGVRGGLQSKSITIQSAFTQGDNRLGHLVLNTPYHFLRGLSAKDEKTYSFYPTLKHARDKLPHYTRKENIKIKKNIILIIMESFSLDSLETGHMSWMKNHLSSSKHLSNGKRSIEALPSLLCGLPSLLQNPITKSIYQSNRFLCLTDVLKKQGYQNLFFHGGQKGTMNFDSFVESHGVEKYFSAEDDTDSTHHDGVWGVYDHHFFDLMEKKLSESKSPFFAGFFSLSSHQPYSIPSSLKENFKSGPLEIHQSIQYADWSLARFISKNKNQAWFKNSLIIITADHTQKIELEKFNNFIGQYRVPLVILNNGEVQQISKVTQHSDIPNIILEMIGEKDQIGFGRSLSDPTEAVINFSDGQQFFYLHENQVETLTLEGLEDYFHYDWDSGKLVRESRRDNQILKANLQVYFQSLRENIVTPQP